MICWWLGGEQHIFNALVKLASCFSSGGYKRSAKEICDESSVDLASLCKKESFLPKNLIEKNQDLLPPWLRNSHFWSFPLGRNKIISLGRNKRRRNAKNRILDLFFIFLCTKAFYRKIILMKPSNKYSEQWHRISEQGFVFSQRPGCSFNCYTKLLCISEYVNFLSGPQLSYL